MMNTPFSFFDKIYCIHLPKYPDRLKKLKLELEKVGIDFDKVQLIHAEQPPEDFHISNMARAPRGEFGCNLSQIKAVVKSIKDENS